MKLKHWLLFFLVVLTICLAFSPYIASAGGDTEEGEQVKTATTEEEKVEVFTEEATKEKYVFQAEVSRLMKLIINSLYKTKEIFLRELISNASDALDKIRFLALTDANALGASPDLNITILADKENRQLIITDTGIGMTKKQLRENLGTIAKSGTSEFLEAIDKKTVDITQIGQFGVGFYSVFLIADKVTVVTKHNDEDKQYIWESQAVNDFTIAEDPRGSTLGRGTQIVIDIKDDSLEFLEENILDGLVKKYSEFISFPIHLRTTKEEEVEIDEEDTGKSKGTEEVDDDDLDEPEIEDVLDKEEGKKRKTKKVTTHQWTLMNDQKPIWTRDPKNVTDKEYEEFYASLTRDASSTPLTWIHFKAEGEVDFRSIVYIPSKAPNDMFRKAPEDAFRNLKLFVKRVFITDEFHDFIPKYLQFIRAVIDADDLPLNVSRETLQQHKTLALIKKYLIKKILEMIKNLAKNDDEKYATFIKEFGTNLKLGAIEDNNNRKTIAKLLRFSSSYTVGNLTSLDDYISRMKKGQTQIYFSSGASIEEIEQYPALERLLARNYEVLYFPEPIDEMLVQHMPGYNGKIFMNVAKGDLEYGDETLETKDELKELQEKFVKLIDWMQATLFDLVEKVKVSNRLTSSPCAVIAQSFAWSPYVERVMSAQTFKQDDPMMKIFANQKKILEINPNHPLILGLLEKANADDFDDKTKESVHVLFETTLIRSGYLLNDPLSYAARVEKILRANLGVDPEATVEIDEEPAPELDDAEKKQQAEKLAKQEAKDLFEEQEDDDQEVEIDINQFRKEYPRDEL